MFFYEHILCNKWCKVYRAIQVRTTSYVRFFFLFFFDEFMQISPRCFGRTVTAWEEFYVWIFNLNISAGAGHQPVLTHIHLHPVNPARYVGELSSRGGGGDRSAPLTPSIFTPPPNHYWGGMNSRGRLENFLTVRANDTCLVIFERKIIYPPWN